jgi:GntR family transcriptional regulator
MLPRTSSLSGQVKTHLRQRILNLEFDEGRVPGEVELSDMLGVSRATVREALAQLEQEGIIWRRQGAGTFVNLPGLQIKTRLEEIWSYEAVLRAHGYVPTTEVLQVTQDVARGATASALAMAEGEPIIVVYKLFKEDDTPVILTINRIPVAQILSPYEQETFTAPIYQFLMSHCQQRLAYYVSEIIPMISTGNVAQWLDVEKGSPLITFDETGFNDANQPVLTATSYFRDDLLRLKLIRRQP